MQEDSIEVSVMEKQIEIKPDPIMTETGTILMEKKNVTKEIESILLLDDKDPIRKLQLYFKDGHYGKDYTDSG